MQYKLLCCKHHYSTNWVGNEFLRQNSGQASSLLLSPPASLSRAISSELSRRVEGSRKLVFYPNTWGSPPVLLAGLHS